MNKKELFKLIEDSIKKGNTEAHMSKLNPV